MTDTEPGPDDHDDHDDYDDYSDMRMDEEMRRGADISPDPEDSGPVKPAAAAGPMTDTAVLVDGLRAWARGMYTTEAAAELLIRACNGRLLRGPWIRTDQAEPGIVWLDTGRVEDAAYLSGGELRVLRIAASLASSQFSVSLSDEIPGLGRGDLELVLAAVAHAGGSHEHSDIRIDVEAGVFEDRGYFPSLYPWPAKAGDPAEVTR